MAVARDDWLTALTVEPKYQWQFTLIFTTVQKRTVCHSFPPERRRIFDHTRKNSKVAGPCNVDSSPLCRGESLLWSISFVHSLPLL